jgi:hypothetical protein
MAELSQPPLASEPDPRQPSHRRGGGVSGVLPALGTVVAVIAGTALLGAAAGLIWAAVAPRALAVVVGPGSADVVNPETNAFIAAEGWFTLLSLIGGIISGLLGYWLAVRRRGALAMAGVLAGGVAAALLAKWIGQQWGTAAFNHTLMVGRAGVTLYAPLVLGGIGALAFWPLAAGVTAGGIEASAVLRERRLARERARSFGLPVRYGPVIRADSDRPAPGSAGPAPGSAGPAPGLSGSAPGPAGSAPGPAGSAPGPAGSAPGPAGSAPGSAGSAPGSQGPAA